MNLDPTSYAPAPSPFGGIAGGDANNANNNPFRQRLLQFLQQIQQGRANGGHPILDWLQQMRSGVGDGLHGVGPGHPMDVLSSGRTPPPAVGGRPLTGVIPQGRVVGPFGPGQGSPFGGQTAGNAGGQLPQLPQSPFAGGFNLTGSGSGGFDPQAFKQALMQRLGGGQGRAF